MQSVLLYGRILSRAIAKGIYDVSSSTPSSANTNIQQPNLTTAASSGYSSQDSLAKSATQGRNVRFLTAVSGFPKNRGNLIDKVKPGKFGDDAYFIAKHTTSEVIGRFLGLSVL